MCSKPTLYYKSGSPPVRSVLLVAKAINLDLDLKALSSISAEHLEPWYVKLNPQHTVPTLVETDGRCLWDSHAICTYLIDKYGGANGDHPLYPRDLFTRARIEQRMHFEATILFPAARLYIRSIRFTGGFQPTAEHKAAAHAAYDLLESFLETDAYLVGEKLTVADLSTVTTLTQLIPDIPLDATKHANVLAWIRRLELLPYFHETNTVNLKNFYVFLNDLKIKNKAAATEMKLCE